MPRVPSFLLPLLLAASAAFAHDAPHWASPGVEHILIDAATPAELRSRLLAHAVELPESLGAERGEAYRYAGLSFARDGHPDSARICYERALALRGAPEDRDALAEALLLGARGADARRALEVLGPRLQQALAFSEREVATTRGRQAWALFAEGRGDSALRLLRSARNWLLSEFNPDRRQWRYRLGLLEVAHGDASEAIEILVPLALASRLQDRDVLDMLREAARKTSSAAAVPALLRREMTAREEEEQVLLDSLRAQRVTFLGADRFPLGGVVFPSRGPGTARAVIAVRAPEEPFEAYASLGSELGRAGYSLLVLDPRGSGRSVDARCPLPETWRGRESAMHDQVAGDIPAALAALARAAPVDTSDVLLVGTGPTASMVTEAARLDPRVRILVLIAPDPSPVELGPMRARIQDLRLPVFFQIPAAEAGTLPFAEVLYRAADPRVSRIAESDRIGRGVRNFRHDPTALPRLLRWINENWRAPGRPAPRRG